MTDLDLDERLRRTLHAVAELDELPGDVAPSAPRGRPARWLAVGAAAAVAAGVAVVVLPEDGPSTTARAVDGRSATVEELLLDEVRAAELRHAESWLLGECMASKGQAWVVDERTFPDLDEHWPQLGRTDADRADVLGYEPLPTDGAQADGRSPVLSRLDGSARDAWSRAYDGVADDGSGERTTVSVVDPVTGEGDGEQTSGGCFGEVQGLLYDDQARHTSLWSFAANQVANEVVERARDDERTEDGLAAWRACMADAGHPFDHPFDPIGRYAEAGVTDEERSIATTDVGCKRSSGLLDAYVAALRDASATLADEHRALLDELRTIEDRALARAAGYRSRTTPSPWWTEELRSLPWRLESIDGTAATIVVEVSGCVSVDRTVVIWTDDAVEVEAVGIPTDEPCDGEPGSAPIRVELFATPRGPVVPA